MFEQIGDGMRLLLSVHVSPLSLFFTSICSRLWYKRAKNPGKKRAKPVPELYAQCTRRRQ